MPDTVPSPAGPWISGIGNAPNVPPQTMINPTPPAIEGLSGGIPLGVPTVGGPAQPSVEGPATHETVARHILDALGGSDGGPMSWAKSILAGTLAGAANVGHVEGGQGWLTGAGRGAQGVIQQKRQQMLDKRAADQVEFEKQEKLKADARAEQELKIHMEDATVQRAMWNAQTAASIQTRQQNAARFPTLQKEDQARLTELQQKIQASEQDNLAVLSAAGVDITKLEHVTGYDQLTTDHAKQAGAGSIFAVPNGEEHKEGEDKAGAYIVPGNIWEETIKKPVTITTGYTVDKDGNAVPQKITAQEGTKVGTLLAIAKGAQMDLAKKQEQIFNQAKLEHERAGTEHEKAETKLALSNIGAGGPQKDILGGEYTPPAGGSKETNKVRDSFKKDADELAKTEGTYGMFQQVLSDINAGKDVTGAQSVVALFNAIGLSATPLKGMGMRINNNTVEEHATARGLGESAYQKFLRLKKGDVITPNQIKDYATIAMQARRDAYVNKINQARSAGVDPSFLLPKGNGRHIDANTAQIFYDSAAGNTPQEKSANAQKAAQATGWHF